MRDGIAVGVVGVTGVIYVVGVIDGCDVIDGVDVIDGIGVSDWFDVFAVLLVVDAFFIGSLLLITLLTTFINTLWGLALRTSF